jgi:hypothetical protein
MEDPNTALRQDVIQNAVNHQMQELEASASSPTALDTVFNSELDHDLITWPRQYLEAFLDSDESGRVPLTPEQLQDVLEAAFERDEALAFEFLEEVRAGKGPQTLPTSSLQVADARASDSKHPYELLFDQTNTEDYRNLSARISALAHSPRQANHMLASRTEAEVERRETTSRLVEHKPGSGVIQVHDKVAGTDVRKLLGGAELPRQVQLVLNELGPEARIDHALTDSGVYRGTILAETVQDLVQRITPRSAVIHRKDHLDAVPPTGEYVRISYLDGVAHVQDVRQRTRNKELTR